MCVNRSRHLGSGVDQDPVVACRYEENGGIDMGEGCVTTHEEDSSRAVDPIHDELTGFANRQALSLLVEYAVARAKRDGDCLTLLWFEISGMNEINQVHGRETGDRALIEFGELLRSELRNSDVVARIGGNEFGVLLAGTDESQAGVVINHLTSVVRERNASTSQPFQLNATVTRASFEPSSTRSTLNALMADALDAMRAGRVVEVR